MRYDGVFVHVPWYKISPWRTKTPSASSAEKTLPSVRARGTDWKDRVS